MPLPIVTPSARQRLLNDLAEELTDLEERTILRQLTPLQASQGALVQIDGRQVVSWCSNDYLGLSHHPALKEATAHAAREWGIGACASRLLAGTTEWHRRLEELLSAWFGAESAIVYPSGYLMNLGTLGALLSSQDFVAIDRCAHASLFDATRATRATLRVFRHNDADHAAALLSRAGKARRRLIVTEGLFSMDGDCAPLPQLLEAADAHDALVYLDDAHGAFALGPSGRGSPEAGGVAHERFLYSGTLGKALGCQGGFVVGPKTLIEFLRNRARTFIYTTALAVPVAAAAVAALHVLGEEPVWREQLHARVRRLHECLAVLHRSSPSVALHPRGSSAETYIVPVVVGTTHYALTLAAHLWNRGIWAPAIRPPTVPEGSARIRVSVTALHTDLQIDELIEALHEGLGRLESA
ncbi:MAG: 8-amino-7-oxononanoate synthase [Candidatus Omnitrophica bacterium]|nr:8-amino-7-oxononanoate synthase [Candidatus Omnitrophota bacterium]